MTSVFENQTAVIKHCQIIITKSKQFYITSIKIKESLVVHLPENLKTLLSINSESNCNLKAVKAISTTVMQFSRLLENDHINPQVHFQIANTWFF